MSNTPTLPSADDLLAGGAKGFKFDEIGATADGIINSKDSRQQTDFATKDLKFWKDGKPMMQLVLSCTDSDGEDFSLYVKGQMLTAVKAAVAKAEVSTLEKGGRIKVKLTEKKPSDKGNPQNIYAAAYTPPAPALEDDDLGI